ncbi:MAG: HAD-IB family phosphatase, partial [Gammaproteobacteria bacterium]
MASDIQFILDFDSTLIRVEMMDVMAEVAIPDPAERADVRQRIRELIDAAMAGRLDYRESLQQRLALLHFPRARIPEVSARLQTLVTPSFLRNRAFLAKHADRIHVLTGGFRQMVEPVIRDLGLRADQLHANTLGFDAAGMSDGCDWDNPLAREGGKIEVVRQLKLDGRVIVVGDGWSDYKIREAGAAARFYAFTENIARPEVAAKADHVAPNFDEVLYDLGLRAAVSYPKNRLLVLLLENIHADAAAAFRKEGYSVATVAGSLDEAALSERLG